VCLDDCDNFYTSTCPYANQPEYNCYHACYHYEEFDDFEQCKFDCYGYNEEPAQEDFPCYDVCYSEGDYFLECMDDCYYSTEGPAQDDYYCYYACYEDDDYHQCMDDCYGFLDCHDDCNNYEEDDDYYMCMDDCLDAQEGDSGEFEDEWY